MKKPTDILKKFADYRSIEYAPYLDCPNEDMRMLGIKPNLVGYVETNMGIMMVLQCPYCFKLFRYHATEMRNATLDEFNSSVLKKLYRDNRFGDGIYFSNGQDLYKKLLDE